MQWPGISTQNTYYALRHFVMTSHSIGPFVQTLRLLHLADLGDARGTLAPLPIKFRFLVVLFSNGKVSPPPPSGESWIRPRLLRSLLKVCSHWPTPITISRPRPTTIIMGFHCNMQSTSQCTDAQPLMSWATFSYFTGLAQYIVLGVTQCEHTIRLWMFFFLSLSSLSAFNIKFGNIVTFASFKWGKRLVLTQSCACGCRGE